MDIEDATALIAPAVCPVRSPPTRPEWWADLGAGRGTFTRVLARLLGPAGRVVAVDRDPAAVAALARLSGRALAAEAAVSAHRADLIAPGALDVLARALGWPPPTGILLANALHFVPAGEQTAVLADLVARLAPGGRLVVVEYEDRAPSRWVPVPVSFARLAALVSAVAGATAARQVGARPSAFGGTMYAAYVERRP